MSKKKKVQKREIPPWLEEGSKQAVDIARGIATREYTPYEGQRIAEIDPNEQRAYELAATEGGAYRSGIHNTPTFSQMHKILLSSLFFIF